MTTSKEKALKLRDQGLSYNDIHNKLGIPKSTLSYWLKNIPSSKLIKNNNELLSKNISAKNITNYNKKRAYQCEKSRMEYRKKHSDEIGNISNRELLLIGTALYWAEGYKKSKWSLIFCNSDPAMVVLMMSFFRNICEVDENKFKPQVQIHQNITAGEAEHYWSRIANLPKDKFLKPINQIPVSSKQKRGNTLPFGTFRLRINDVKQVNRIIGWIDGLKECNL